MFSKSILNWYNENKRDLPWRNKPEAYFVWLSEIMLQQTRVAQGLPYYLRFVEEFPTVHDLAEASQEKVLKLWQGLGYYSRARNLHDTAKVVSVNFGGIFPNNYKDLKKLKGVGDYTASAIASIVYHEPVAVVDGNVYRVLSRFFGVETPINSTEGVKQFKALATKMLAEKSPGLYNQAIMEFGALHCKPKNPQCVTCPVQSNCIAFQQNKAGELPVKLKKQKVRERFFNFLVFQDVKGQMLLQKRVEKDIWQHLYQFPLIESKHNLTLAEIKKTALLDNEKKVLQSIKRWNENPIKHVLSHQKIWAIFWCVEVKKLPENIQNTQQIVNKQELVKFAVPVLMEKFINSKNG
ncbi:A/G-specific adenine glycosylase [Mesonia hippocampi]|uniref:Adenine DNA glycosylase n=1 Tax=Mesonia hippocampi TaxID=1628250 RepID=A0A840EQH5_9FLAO|nr:A/G-specific adenine glycosylase [Mesonia hippocampi]MBB4119305.1 A/G-specific adenine glycosylase [Mesonia hippocampi]